MASATSPGFRFEHGGFVEHVHTPDGPDECFGCKCAYWRTASTALFVYPYGQDRFHETTVAEDIRKMFRDADANGVKPEPCGSIYTGPAVI